MSSRAFTLLELILGITILGLIGVLGGKLLTTSMNQWRDDAERVAVERAANAALRALAEDLQTQINLPAWPNPFSDDWNPQTDDRALPLFSFPMYSNAPVAVVWFIEGNDSDSLSLWRLQASPIATRAALPENAALNQLIDPSNEEQNVQVILGSSSAVRLCESVRSIRILRQHDGFHLSLELAYPGIGERTSDHARTYRAHTYVFTPTVTSGTGVPQED